MSEEKMRFLLELDDSWKVVIMPKEEAPNWFRGNPEAVQIRFAVVTEGGNLPCDTKEEALAEIAANGGKLSIMKPKESIFNKLPLEAIQLLYANA